MATGTWVHSLSTCRLTLTVKAKAYYPDFLSYCLPQVTSLYVILRVYEQLFLGYKNSYSCGTRTVILVM